MEGQKYKIRLYQISTRSIRWR